MSDSIRLSSIAVNCPDAAELAAFYAAITGGQITFSSSAWVTLDSPRRTHRLPDGARPHPADLA